MNNTELNRKTISIKRKPITVLTKNGRSYGGWAHFSKKDADPKPSNIRLKPSETVLFCPYCGAWTIFKRLRDDQYTWKCTGWCGWSNTNDFYVKKENNMFRIGRKSSSNPKKAPKK